MPQATKTDRWVGDNVSSRDDKRIAGSSHQDISLLLTASSPEITNRVNADSLSGHLITALAFLNILLV